MKIFYLNDTNKPVRVYKHNLMPENFVTTLAHAGHVTVDIPRQGAAWIKAWDNVVLLDVIDEDLLK